MVMGPWQKNKSVYVVSLALACWNEMWGTDLPWQTVGNQDGAWTEQLKAWLVTCTLGNPGCLGQWVSAKQSLSCGLKDVPGFWINHSWGFRHEAVPRQSRHVQITTCIQVGKLNESPLPPVTRHTQIQCHPESSAKDCRPVQSWQRCSQETYRATVSLQQFHTLIRTLDFINLSIRCSGFWLVMLLQLGMG